MDHVRPAFLSPMRPPSHHQPAHPASPTLPPFSPCLVFNNATSLPLLLLTSLSTVGTLSQLVLPGDSLQGVLERGKVYVLINALVCNLTR